MNGKPDLVKLLCQLMDDRFGRAPGTSEQLINYVTDRPGHDLRYAIDASKINRALAGRPVTFEEGLAERSTGIFKTRNAAGM